MKPERAEDHAARDTVGATSAIRRVLIVDDSRAHLRLMAKVLVRWGYEVREALSAGAALAILDAEPVDLVLSDWVMPGMSGLDLCRAFRKRASPHYVYFILLTSKTAREDVAIGLAAGADDFLSKPISTDELKARISAGERLVAMQRALEEKNTQLEGALAELQQLYDGIARDLTEARRLQQSLVPERSIDFRDAQVSLLLRPSGQVGGDLVGAFASGENRVCLYAIDVSGHGIASALMTARLAGYLSATSPHRNVALETGPDGRAVMLPLPEVCARLNAIILADLETELYFTMAIADCDLATGRVRVAQAGHPHPLVQRADGGVEFVGAGGLPIGLFPQASYSDSEATLGPGDRLLLYSDGFTEATADGDRMLDTAGLARMAERLRDVSGEEFLEALVWTLADFTGGSEFDDDLSGAMIEVPGAPARS